MAKIYILDEIGGNGVSLASIINQLQAIPEGESLEIIINSPGGDCMDGIGIYDAIKAHKGQKKTIIQGIAASIASIIFLAGDEREISQGSFLMIHDPFSVAMGTADEMRKNADVLDKIKTSLVNIYTTATNQTPESITEMMTTETWLNDLDSVALGFATTIAEDQGYKIAAKSMLILNKIGNIPAEIMAKVETVIEPMIEDKIDTQIDNKIENVIDNKIVLDAVKAEAQDLEIERVKTIKAMSFEGFEFWSLIENKVSVVDAQKIMYDELKAKYSAALGKLAELEAVETKKAEMKTTLESIKAMAQSIPVPQITEQEDPAVVLASLKGVERTKYFRDTYSKIKVKK